MVEAAMIIDTRSMDLFTCAVRYLSDQKKIDNYVPLYNLHFNRFHDAQLNLLELGVKEGQSLRMWREYFYNGVVYGLDQNSMCSDIGQKYDLPIFIGKEQDEFFLRNVMNGIPNGVDILIDDGCHFSHIQKNVFELLFPLLNDGGIYVIEDTDSAYRRGKRHKFEWILNKEKTIIESMKDLIDSVNYNRHGIPSSKLDGMIHSIHIHSGIIFVYKNGK